MKSKLLNAVNHYVSLHKNLFGVGTTELIQVASIKVHGNYSGEILYSHGTIKHQDETPTCLETTQNPGEDYYLWLGGSIVSQLKVGECFYADTRKIHQLWSRSTPAIHWSVGEQQYPDEPWVGLSIAGAKPTNHLLNLYKHILVSAFVSGVGLCPKKSHHSYSFLDLSV